VGQKNILLNETYKEDVKIKSEWGESIEAILCINGIKNMRAEFPLPAHVKFHKDFIQTEKIDLNINIII